RDDGANGFTSKWIVKEVQLARDLSLPYLVFAADGVEIERGLITSALGERVFPLPQSEDDRTLAQTLHLLEEEYKPARRTAYSFFATSLRPEIQETERAVALMEQITCMQCMLGQRLRGQHAQHEIVERIQNAEFVLADISANHLNSLVEAGIARGAHTRL